MKLALNLKTQGTLTEEETKDNMIYDKTTSTVKLWSFVHLSKTLLLETERTSRIARLHPIPTTPFLL